MILLNKIKKIFQTVLCFFAIYFVSVLLLNIILTLLPFLITSKVIFIVCITIGSLQGAINYYRSQNESKHNK